VPPRSKIQDDSAKAGQLECAQWICVNKMLEAKYPAKRLTRGNNAARDIIMPVE
jgi:hypothetical protein